jgi:hypothetical protein
MRALLYPVSLQMHKKSSSMVIYDEQMEFVMREWMMNPNYCTKSSNCKIEKVIDTCWGLVLKCYELRTRQHKILNIKVFRPSKHYFS